jgi:phosphonopyruvate decarboxylase
LLIQNSGFANAINAIASLLVPFKIPALLITSWRGEPGLDSPEHDVLGTAFPDLVRSLKLEMLMLDTEIERTVQNAAAISFSKLCPTVIAITKGALDEPR